MPIQKFNPPGARQLMTLPLRTLVLTPLPITRWVFAVADVEKPILGADFLSHFNLLHLIDNLTHLTDQGIIYKASIPRPTTLPHTEFVSVLISSFSPNCNLQLHHLCKHTHIGTAGPPVTACA